MSKSILRYILLSLVFLFSLAPIAGAQTQCVYPLSFPDGVAFAYKCELDCLNCPVGKPQCKACDNLELVFPDLERCVNGAISDCEEGPVQ
jgi:hypothetical protein